MTRAGHVHIADLLLCGCGQATELLAEMGDKYKQLEASMDENAQVWAKHTPGTGRHHDCLHVLHA